LLVSSGLYVTVLLHVTLQQAVTHEIQTVLMPCIRFFTAFIGVSKQAGMRHTTHARGRPLSDLSILPICDIVDASRARFVCRTQYGNDSKRSASDDHTYDIV